MCKNEINDAWLYWPSDCWYGVYDNDVLTMSHRYAAQASVTATVKEIHISDTFKSIKLELVSNTDQTVEVDWENSNGGDWYGTMDWNLWM